MATLNRIKEIEASIPPVQKGPASVLVQPDFGASGIRGSYILYGYGNPAIADFSLFTGVEPSFKVRQLDWYINLLASDPEYLWVYQYQGTNELSWNRIFKIIPNTYTDKIDVTYTNGVGTISLTIPKVRIPIEEQLKKDIPTSSTKVDNEAEMLTTNISVNQYVFRRDVQRFYQLTSSDYEDIANWAERVQMNILLDIEHTNPVSLSFIIDDIKEVTATSSFQLDMTINAAEISETLSVLTWSKLAGVKPTNITVSML
jgi:hypothetical protein